jgi:hypothetical protein
MGPYRSYAPETSDDVLMFDRIHPVEAALLAGDVGV